MPVKRLNYFHYQFLQEQDFKDEQSYHVAMRRRHNSEFHTFGRVRGLDVSFVAGERRVRISPGTAVDSLGREIVVESNLDVDLQNHPGATVYLTIAHKEEDTDASTQPGVAGNFTRTTESFQPPRISATAPTDASLDLILARITTNPNPPDGAVTAVDFSERTEAGAKIGQTDLPALRFIVPAHGSSEWPRIAGNNVSGPGTGLQGITVDAGITAFSGSVSVAQSMTVQGDLSVQGVINRVSDLEVKDSIIRVNQYEPPTATPMVVNGGLEVFRGGTAPNAQIIWDETADAWRIGIATASGLDTVVTSARLGSHNHDGTAGNGAAVSHTSLSNIVGAVVSSTDATANKHVSNLQAKGWQDHVNIAAGNPHGTTAAQVGALPASDYAFARAVSADVIFHQGMANGASQTVITNFPTKFVWISGSANAFLAGRWFGGALSGYADLRGTIVQRVNGAIIERMTVAPFWSTQIQTYNAFCGASFEDRTVTPVRLEGLLVTVTSVTSTGFVLTLSRSVPSTTTVTFAPMTNFTITLRMLCFG
jgi:hypothetical protein